MNITEQIQADRATSATCVDCPSCGKAAKAIPDAQMPRPLDPRVYRRWLTARECACGWENKNARFVRSNIEETT